MSRSSSSSSASSPRDIPPVPPIVAAAAARLPEVTDDEDRVAEPPAPARAAVATPAAAAAPPAAAAAAEDLETLPFSEAYPRLLERFDGPVGLEGLIEKLLPAARNGVPRISAPKIKAVAFERRLCAAVGAQPPAPDSPAHSRWTRHIFEAFDRDGAGAVSRASLGVGLQTLLNSPRRPVKRNDDLLHAERGGVSESDQVVAAQQAREKVCRATFNVYDTDGNGQISLREFAAQLKRALRMARAIAAISAIEKNGAPSGAGAYTDAQISSMAGAMAAKCFKEADIDHSGAIDYDEFRRWFLNRTKGSAEKEESALEMKTSAQKKKVQPPPQPPLQRPASSKESAESSETNERTGGVEVTRALFASMSERKERAAGRSSVQEGAALLGGMSTPKSGSFTSFSGSFGLTIVGSGPLGMEIGIDVTSGLVVLQAIHEGGAFAKAVSAAVMRTLQVEPREGDLITAVNGRKFSPFDAIDTDHDGKITLLEMETFLRALGHDEDAEAVARDLLAHADLDGDGVVDAAEFKQYIAESPSSIDVVAEVFSNATRPLTLTLERLAPVRFDELWGGSRESSLASESDSGEESGEEESTEEEEEVRSKMTVEVHESGPLGAELTTLLVPHLNQMVVAERGLHRGGKLEEVGVESGDWLLTVNDRALDVMGFLDADGDGQVSLEELDSALKKINVSIGGKRKFDATKMMAMYDKDGSGDLDMEELAALLNDVLLPMVVELLAAERPLRLTLSREL